MIHFVKVWSAVFLCKQLTPFLATSSKLDAQVPPRYRFPYNVNRCVFPPHDIDDVELHGRWTLETVNNHELKFDVSALFKAWLLPTSQL